MFGVEQELQEEITRLKARIEKLTDGLKFISDQHCPAEVSTYLGRTLKLCVEYAETTLKDCEDAARSGDE